MRNYPADWQQRRQRVLERHLNRCVNCHRLDSNLEVHHIVPVGQAGSHQISNLVPLCPECHQASHGERMAPRVKWFTNGELTEEEFNRHDRLWKQMRDRLGVPRFDPDQKCVYVPLADADEIIERIRA